MHVFASPRNRESPWNIFWRGRKPRIKTEPTNTLIPKKKRGRKRRDRFYSLSIEQKHELFERNGNDLVVSLHINFIDSICHFSVHMIRIFFI